MKVWLVQTWEPNPLDDPNGRPWRTGILAQRLAARGHHVHWWASQFAHMSKQMRKPTPGTFPISKNIEITLIPALGYPKNVCLQRLKDHRFVAQQWRQLAESSPKPEVIVLSFPPVEIGLEVANFAKTHNIPLLTDVRDQYPDVYWQSAPNALKNLIEAACAPIKAKVGRIMAASDAITGNGPDSLQWGLNYAGRPKSDQDQILYMSYEPPAPSNQPKRPMAIFAGTIGSVYDADPVYQAARELKKIEFVFCGDGPMLEIEKSKTKDIPNVTFLGRLPSSELHDLLQQATYALIAYKNIGNFRGTITNKTVEATAYGLPILTSLTGGLVEQLITQYQAGIAYKNSADLVSFLKSTDPHQCAQGSSQIYRDLFHPEIVYGKWIELIERFAK